MCLLYSRGRHEVVVPEGGVWLFLYGELLSVQQRELDLLWARHRHQVRLLRAVGLEVHPVTVGI